LFTYRTPNGVSIKRWKQKPVVIDELCMGQDNIIFLGILKADGEDQNPL